MGYAGSSDRVGLCPLTVTILLQFAVSLNPTCVNTFNVSKSSKGSYVFSNLDPLLAYNLTVSAIVGGVVGVPATLSIPSLGVPVGELMLCGTRGGCAACFLPCVVGMFVLRVVHLCCLLCVPHSLCAGPCGVDTTFNGLTVLALFIGLLLGAALGWVMAQVFQKPAGEKVRPTSVVAYEGPSLTIVYACLPLQTDAMNANPMRK